MDDPLNDACGRVFEYPSGPPRRRHGPLDLPNLAALRPPGGNTRPEGIADSYFERRRRGERLEAC